MFEQSSGKWVEAIARGRQTLERLAVAIEQRQHQATQRFVGNVRRRQRLQLGEHRRGVVARMLDELQRIETVRVVGVVDGTNGLHFGQLGAVAFVFAVDGAQLVELADLPIALAFFVARAVLPDHEGGAAASIAETAGVVGFALARRALGLLGQECEKVGLLAGGQFTKWNRRWFGSAHVLEITENGGKNRGEAGSLDDAPLAVSFAPGYYRFAL